MSDVGWVGLGKLGLTCSLTLHVHGGHKVHGYDVSDKPSRIIEGIDPPLHEEGFYDLLQLMEPDGYQVHKSIGDVVAASDIVFVAVQTPHALNYGGRAPAPNDRKDFEYAFLVQAVRDVCQAALTQQKHISVAVVSTVLPGTSNRLLRPLMNEYTRFIYTPAFIAMGTTAEDYRNPEFVICGVDRREDAEALRDVFVPLHYNDRLNISTVETAELIKVAYNTFISLKIVWANTMMEICQKTGADCDDLVDALALAHDRVISPKYMRGGMGDGGACHPRDLIAMSWLAERLDLSYDLLGEMVRARESQTEYLAHLARHYSDVGHLPIVILGKSYKPGSTLVYGSPAYLLAHYLGDDVSEHYDPYCDKAPVAEPSAIQIKPSVVVIATKHPEFAEYNYAPGSIVLDVFGYVPDREGVTVIRVGRK